MKKNVSILLIVLLILVISTLILFAEEAKYDFRKTNWGMSREQVKEIEKSRLVVEDFGKEESLIYEGEIDGLDGQIFYYFMRGKLIRARYVIRRPSIKIVIGTVLLTILPPRYKMT